jgi:hypothetical protein
MERVGRACVRGRSLASCHVLLAVGCCLLSCGGCFGEIMARDVQIQNMVENRVDQALDSAVSALTERNDNRLADISSQLQQQHPSSSHQPSGTSPQGMCGVSNVSAGASSNSANMSAALGWGLTPSGNGAIPPSLLLSGMPTFGNPVRQGQLSSQWPSQQPSHSAVQFPSLQQALPTYGWPW